MIPHPMPWVHPLDLARAMPDHTLALLYSGVPGPDARFSWLAVEAAETIRGDDFSPLAARLGSDGAAMDNAWFGYLGYGLKHGLERLPADAPGQFRLPPLRMTRFGRIFQFDHAEQTLTCWAATPPPRYAIPPRAPARVSIEDLASNMSKAAYLGGVSAILDAIRAGELYQANLTRKFTGRFAGAPDTFALFETLCDASPAAYSAYLRFDDTAILSSSPEQFLRMDAAGNVCTRPIKGSAARSSDATEDAALRAHLAGSAKDRAENLMIVDLMRNDLSRACMAGSVHAERLFEVTSHATVHHLSSTVCGQKAPAASALDVVKACFPPGSMTGAPKIRAMQRCTLLEKQERGVYSGALGWFGGDGSMDLSVVIRTLIVQGNAFEFQVGGGIVADSTPEAEWAETLVKAAGIARALGIARDALAAL